MTTIRHLGKEYGAHVRDGTLTIYARPGSFWQTIQLSSEQSAIAWLCDRGCKKSKSKKLITAVLEGGKINEGKTEIQIT